MRNLLILGTLLFLAAACARPPAESPEAAPQEAAPEAPEAPAEQPETLDAGCEAFPDMLDSCEPYTCEFVHPLTEETLERTIVGTVDGNCQYTETMPNGGLLTCDLPGPMQEDVVQYMRDVIAAESVGTTYEGGEATYFVDGVETDNPLEAAMMTGACTISGY